jgi:hypothetical protein
MDFFLVTILSKFLEIIAKGSKYFKDNLKAIPSCCAIYNLYTLTFAPIFAYKLI